MSLVITVVLFSHYQEQDFGAQNLKFIVGLYVLTQFCLPVQVFYLLPTKDEKDSIY